jgi:hypothetical protein
VALAAIVFHMKSAPFPREGEAGRPNSLAYSRSWFHADVGPPNFAKLREIDNGLPNNSFYKAMFSDPLKFASTVSSGTQYRRDRAMSAILLPGNYYHLASNIFCVSMQEF